MLTLGRVGNLSLLMVQEVWIGMAVKDIYSSYAFFGRGKCGPRLFMTDDSEAERKALLSTYKDSTLLLCTFHILQAMWHFLWDGKHKITKEHRPQLLRMVKRLLYCNSEQNFDDIYQCMFLSRY